jgi:hypothetical protein
MALSQVSWALVHMGLWPLPWAYTFKPAMLEKWMARMGLRLMNNRKFEWVGNDIRLSARNLVEIPRRLKGFSFDDNKIHEPRC